MDPDAIVALIKDACERLSKAYAAQGRTAQQYTNKLSGALDNTGMWKCTFGLFHEAILTRVDWYDDKPSEWTIWWKSYKRVELDVVNPPGKEDARQALEELKKKTKELYGTEIGAEGKFNFDAKDLGDSATTTGKFITDWLKISQDFSKNVALAIPQSPSGISANGNLDGWLSSGASKNYEEIFSLQDGAATTTSQVITALTSRTASLLSRLNTYVAELAQASINEQKYIQDMIDAFPTEWKLGALKDAISAAVSAYIRFQENQVNKLKLTGQMLTDTIEHLVDTQGLINTITEMGNGAGDEGWPQLLPMSVTQGTCERPSEMHLRYNTRYFQENSAFWRGISGTLSGLAGKGNDAQKLEAIFLRVPEFQAASATALQGVANQITTLALDKGKTKTNDLATLLDQTIADYLKAEAETQGVAQRVYKEIYGQDLP